MSTHGGARLGAGRKPKTLIEHVRDGSFNVSRHAHLLADDDSVLDAAAVAPADAYGLHELAGYCRILSRGERAVRAWCAGDGRELCGWRASPLKPGISTDVQSG